MSKRSKAFSVKETISKSVTYTCTECGNEIGYKEYCHKCWGECYRCKNFLKSEKYIYDIDELKKSENGDKLCSYCFSTKYRIDIDDWAKRGKNFGFDVK